MRTFTKYPYASPSWCRVWGWTWQLIAEDVVREQKHQRAMALLKSGTE